MKTDIGTDMKKEVEDFLTQVRDSIHIDKYNLDEELVNHPEIYLRISELYSQAVSIRDQAYEQIKNKDAEVNLSTRTQLEGTGKKYTEGLVASLVREDPSYKKAVQDHLEAKELVDKLSAFKEAFDKRGYMLRDLVHLFVSGYFQDRFIKDGSETKKQRDHEQVMETISKSRRDRR